MPTTEQRRRAVRFGRLAEAMCRFRLRLFGWRILAANWRTPVGEIDIVARRGDQIAFVEVKARTDGSAETAAPTPKQRQRIARAAELFLARDPAFGTLCGRFDVMYVQPWPSFRFLWPHHISDAWRHTPN